MCSGSDIRVALCGTSCTGKTTLARALHQHPRISPVFPTMIPEGIQELLEESALSFAKMDPQQTRDFQLRYIDWKKRAELASGNWLADRSFVDVAAVWVERDAKDNLPLQTSIVTSCRTLSRNYSHLIHLPPGSIDLEDNGVRQLDAELHERTAQRIVSYLEEWELPHFTLKANGLQNRVNEVVQRFEQLGFIPPI